MHKRLLALLLTATLSLSTTPAMFASGYDAHPKLVVVVVIDQFRADYLQRYRSEFKGHGFRLFLDKGAYFPDCYYGYANTKTAPGHAALGTGAYSDGNGIAGNQWWDLTRSKTHPVTSVEDERYTLVGASAEPGTGEGSPVNSSPVSVQQEEAASATAPASSPAPAATAPVPASASTPGPAAKPAKSTVPPGASPRNLLASTVGDELRLATEGQSRLYGVSLKDRAAILPAGASANGAFWIDPVSGHFQTSSYYMTALPEWAQAFDNGPAIQQAATEAGVTALTNFYSQVGITNAANTYEVAFAEALITGEQLGSHATTDMLTLSLSPNDIEGHHFGPDSPEEHAMVTGLDTDLDSFFTWLDKNVPGGLANVVIALSADHGIAPTPAVAEALGLPGAYISIDKLVADLNQAMNAKFSPGENVVYLLPHQELPYLSLNRPSFERAGINEQEAEDAVKTAMAPAFARLAPPAAPAPGDAPLPSATAPPAATPPTPAAGSTGAASATPTAANASTETASAPPAPPPARPEPAPQLFRSFTRVELAAGDVPPTEYGRLLAHSYSPNGGWYVAAFPVAFQMEGYGSGGTTHFSAYSYDRHVPLGFYGAPFTPGTYRGRVEPIDLAATLASVLGVNQPSASIGQILTQALKPVGEFTYPKPDGTADHAVRGRRRSAHAAPDASPAPDARPATPNSHTPAAAAPARPSATSANSKEQPHP